ncbi:MAG: hypothetical protein WCK90_01655 [archaeon]
MSELNEYLINLVRNPRCTNTKVMDLLDTINKIEKIKGSFTVLRDSEKLARLYAELEADTIAQTIKEHGEHLTLGSAYKNTPENAVALAREGTVSNRIDLIIGDSNHSIDSRVLKDLQDYSRLFDSVEQTLPVRGEIVTGKAEEICRDYLTMIEGALESSKKEGAFKNYGLASLVVKALNHYGQTGDIRQLTKDEYQSIMHARRTLARAGQNPNGRRLKSKLDILLGRK